MNGMRGLVCPHTSLTPPDADGEQLCQDCGTVFRQRDLAGNIARGYLAMCRDLGGGRRRENTEDELDFAAELLRKMDRA